MKKPATIIFFLALAVVMVIILTDLPFWANAESPENKTADMAQSDMQGMPGMNNDAASQANKAMSRDMDMGPHMKMTNPRPIQTGDQEKAGQIAEQARKVAEKYEDYKVALASGFHIFMPNIQQKQYHFNNYDYAHEAIERFNPDHPTSLLYEKHGNVTPLSV